MTAQRSRVQPDSSVAPVHPRCYTSRVPTTRPRYTVTDTGQTAQLLDLAERAWPQITDRRQLLLRLTEAGGRMLEAELADQDQRRERQRIGLERASRLVDVDELVGDGAWR
jgi:hypothetical protein